MHSKTTTGTAPCGPACAPHSRPTPSLRPLGARPPCQLRQGGGRAGPITQRRRAAAGGVLVRASGFAELKRDAEEDYRRVRDLLPTLETAKHTAEHAHGPSQDAEAAWQESHRRHCELQDQINALMGGLKTGLIDAAGGEAEATQQLVAEHMRFRMRRFRAQLEPRDWEEYSIKTMSVPIQGVQLLTQVAACEWGGRAYAVVCVALGGPFLNNGVQSLLLHWGAARPGGKWEAPPEGWKTSPSVTNAQGRAWQTQFGHYAPMVEGALVEPAAVHSVILQLPLEGPLEVPGGGVPFVLKRTDGGGPEWVKRDHHHDFMLDLTDAIAHFARKAEAAAAAAASAASPKSESFLASWGLDAWDWGRTIASSDGEASKGKLKGWMSQVTSWEEVREYQHPTLVQLLQRLRLVVRAVAMQGGASKSFDSRPLVNQCSELEANLKALDAAELAAVVAQKRKEELKEVYTSAEATVARLREEISGTLDTARRTVVRLRGRNTEITQRDLEILAAQLAEEMSKREEEAQRSRGTHEGRGRQLVFLQENLMRLAGVEGSVLVQTYLEGPKPAPGAPATATAAPVELPAKVAAAVDAVLNGAKGGNGSHSDSEAGTAAAAAAAPPPRPEFEHVLVSVVAAEDFPDTGIRLPLVLHWAGVPHEGGSWLQPPEGWAASSSGESRREGSATQTPMSRYRVTAEDGGPVFVDPTLFGACLRLPLRGCKEANTLGLEFVLKGGGKDGAWLLRQQAHGRSSNFFHDLPRLA